MIKCWYLRNSDGEKLKNPRGANQTANHSNSVNKISWGSLSRLNIKYWNLEVANYQKFNTFSLITEREGLGYQQKEELKAAEFGFRSHMHDIAEARFIIDGAVYYDVYDEEQKLIRMHLLPGDFIIIPKYQLHRTIIPQDAESVTFLQLTPDAKVQPKIYFFEDIQKKPLHFIRFMRQPSVKTPVKKVQSEEKMSERPVPNGTGYVMGGRAKALASYPHLREYQGMLFVSGTSSRRPDNTHIGATKIDDDEWDLDIRKQTRAVLENIKIILGTVGAGLQHCLAVTVFLVDFKDYQGMNEVYNEYFDGDTGPTRTTVAVARLPHPNLLIEIQCTAAMPKCGC